MFRTKAELVKRIYDVTFVGDQQDVPFRERPELHSVLAEHDPVRKLAGYSHLMRQVAEHVLPVYRQLRAAVTVGEGEDELCALADTADAERLFGACGIVRDLLTVTSLRPGLPEEQAVDLVWMAMSPEFWSLLVSRRGWTWADAEAWVAGHLRVSLLAGDGGSTR